VPWATWYPSVVPPFTETTIWPGVATSTPSRPSPVGPCDENDAIESIETIGWRPLAEAPLESSFFATEGDPIEPASGPSLPAETTIVMSSWSQTNLSTETARPSSATGATRPHELL
jgi:hypothetical protein